MATRSTAGAKHPGRVGDALGDACELVTRAISVAYYAWLPDRDELHFSPAALDLFGYAPGELTRQRAEAAIRQDDRLGYRSAMVAFLKGTASHAEFVYRARTAGGEYRWLRDRATVERDTRGRVTRLVGALSDITDAKRREAENSTLIARQTASIEVLRAISASPDDPQPVFELILRRASELCNAQAGNLVEYDGALMHQRALEGFDPEAVARLRAVFPRPPGHDTLPGRVVLSGQIVHLADAQGDKDLIQQGRGLGARAFLGVPLMREGRVIGVLGLARFDAGEYDGSAIELVQSFAEQAVIAIAGAATLRELRTRTAELAERNSAYSERIEQQAATIDVLQAMSASPGDAQPVFETIARRAKEFCEADGSAVILLENGQLHLRTHVGFSGAAAQTYEAAFPRPVDNSTVVGRAIIARGAVFIPDFTADPDYALKNVGTASAMRSSAAVPLLRDGEPIGGITIGRFTLGAYSDAQMELLKTFTEQAAIAAAGAATYRALQERTAALAQRNSEYGERIEHQSATIDVLKVMAASPGDPQPVFDLIAVRARDICCGYGVTVFEFDGSLLHWRAATGVSEDPAVREATKASYPMLPTRDRPAGRAVLDRQIVHIRDNDAEPGLRRTAVEDTVKSIVTVPMMRGGVVIGALAMGSREKGGFSHAQVDLLKTFAEQAVIAINSAETYRELQARTAALAERNSEYGERIEQQAATIDVLKTMSRSPDDTEPVFHQIVHRARDLCNGYSAALFEFDGELVHLRGHSLREDFSNQATLAAYAAAFPMAPARSSISCQAILDKQIIHVRDTAADSELSPAAQDVLKDVGSQMSIPLLRDDRAIGAITLNAPEPGGFTDSQVALLQTFAEQAVIAITSVANFRALRELTAELTHSVAELQALEEVLRAVNSSLDLDTVLSTIISRSTLLSQSDEGTIYEFDETEQVFVPKSAYGMNAERVAALRKRRIRLGETHLGRSATLRAPVVVDDIQQDPTVNASEVLPGIHAVLAVPLLREDKVIGGLVIRRRTGEGFAPATVTLMQTFAGQAVLAIENARLFQEAGRARSAAETALVDLRRAQDRLVQAEKMASLGQLTAGIAHEIKNPLNFVNNFSELSRDLLDELNAAVGPEKLSIAADLRAEIDDVTATLKSNLEKIAQHGRRADSIVKNMLLHSRSGPSEHRAIELNVIAEEALNLAYHGTRAETPGFNITLKKDLDPAAGTVELHPQEFIRVMVYLFNNGFYAARKRAGEPGFEPMLWLTTFGLDDRVEIRVRDNGTGISKSVREKIFEPFFTTKPAGEGTGLGLSLSYDIIVKQHGGQLTVDSKIDAFTEFLITLPRAMAANDGGRA